MINKHNKLHSTSARSSSFTIDYDSTTTAAHKLAAEQGGEQNNNTTITSNNPHPEEEQQEWFTNATTPDDLLSSPIGAIDGLSIEGGAMSDDAVDDHWISNAVGTRESIFPDHDNDSELVDFDTSSITKPFSEQQIKQTEQQREGVEQSPHQRLLWKKLDVAWTSPDHPIGMQPEFSSTRTSPPPLVRESIRSGSGSGNTASHTTPTVAATCAVNDRGWGEWDVPLGRSQEVREFIGNQRYRALVEQYREAYIKATRRVEKTCISNTIFATIHGHGGRFLDKKIVSSTAAAAQQRSNDNTIKTESDHGGAPSTTTTCSTAAATTTGSGPREQWYEISQEKALAKISQALRIPSSATNVDNAASVSLGTSSGPAPTTTTSFPVISDGDSIPPRTGQRQRREQQEGWGNAQHEKQVQGQEQQQQFNQSSISPFRQHLPPLHPPLLGQGTPASFVMGGGDRHPPVSSPDLTTRTAPPILLSSLSSPTTRIMISNRAASPSSSQQQHSLSSPQLRQRIAGMVVSVPSMEESPPLPFPMSSSAASASNLFGSNDDNAFSNSQQQQLEQEQQHLLTERAAAPMHMSMAERTNQYNNPMMEMMMMGQQQVGNHNTAARLHPPYYLSPDAMVQHTMRETGGPGDGVVGVRDLVLKGSSKRQLVRDFQEDDHEDKEQIFLPSLQRHQHHLHDSNLSLSSSSESFLHRPHHQQQQPNMDESARTMSTTSVGVHPDAPGAVHLDGAALLTGPAATNTASVGVHPGALGAVHQEGAALLPGPASAAEAASTVSHVQGSPRPHLQRCQSEQPRRRRRLSPPVHDSNNNDLSSSIRQLHQRHSFTDGEGFSQSPQFSPSSTTTARRRQSRYFSFHQHPSSSFPPSRSSTMTTTTTAAFVQEQHQREKQQHHQRQLLGQPSQTTNDDVFPNMRDPESPELPRPQQKLGGTGAAAVVAFASASSSSSSSQNNEEDEIDQLVKELDVEPIPVFIRHRSESPSSSQSKQPQSSRGNYKNRHDSHN